MNDRTVAVARRACFVFTLAAFLCVVVVMRNMEPLVFPYLYAEDGVWLSKILNHKNWLDVGLTVRDFPVLGVAGIHRLSIFFVDLALGGNIGQLPVVLYWLSVAFFCLTGLLVFLYLGRYSSFWARVVLAFSVALIPVGGDGNEIFGRALNLVFLFPVLQCALMCRLLDNDTRWAEFFLIWVVAVFCSLTFPVGGGFFLVAAMVMFISARHSGEGGGRAVVVRLGMMAAGFVIFMAFMPIAAFSGKGAANLPFSWSGFVEFSIARVFLYPFIPQLYSHLSDFVTLLIVLPFFAFVGVLIWRILNSVNEIRGRVLFVFGCFVVYYLATVLMRRGFTSVFGSYQSSFPDRYFFGLNLLFVLLVVLLVDRADWLASRWRSVALGAIILAFLGFGAGVGSLFEMWKPRMTWKEFGTFAYSVCKGAISEGVEVKAQIPPVINEGAFTIVIPPDRIEAVRESCRRSKRVIDN